jgi:hypothetical protein
MEISTSGLCTHLSKFENSNRCQLWGRSDLEKDTTDMYPTNLRRFYHDAIASRKSRSHFLNGDEQRVIERLT